MDIADYGDLLEALQNDDEWICDDVGQSNSACTSSATIVVKSDQQDSADASTPSAKHLEVLSKYFGHSQFRPLQWQIIYNILHHRRDICAIMSTGYGKSLCYQYPAMYSGGVVLVVSPLIALMEDQVIALKVANIPACFLGSAQSESSTVSNDILHNKYSIIYVSPEYCQGEVGTRLLQSMNEKLKMTLIAVDEAHCVSQWGHDFRGSYRKVGDMRKIFPSVPILAVTATATPQVRDDICKSLKLRFFLKDITDPTYLQHTMDMMQELQKYLENQSCRRVFILKHFEGSQFVLDANYDPDSCCDVCRQKRESEEDAHDFSEDAKLLLRTAEQFNGKSGLGKMILALRGSNSKDVYQKIKSSEIFGAGKAKPEAWWKGLGRLLLKEKYLEECVLSQGWPQRKESGFALTTVGIARKGEEYLRRSRSDASCPPLKLVPSRDLKAMLDRENQQKQRRAMLVAATSYDEANGCQEKQDLDMFRFTRAAMQIPSTSGTAVPAQLSEEDKAEQALEKQLFDGLVKIRAELALRDNIMPYTVASTSALVQLSLCRPSTLQHFTKVNGFNEAKIEKFGQEFLTFVTDFCKEHNLRRDKFPDATPQGPPATTAAATSAKCGLSTSVETASTDDWEVLLQGTTQLTYRLFQIEQMPKLKSGTAIGHLCSAIKLGLPVDIDRLGFTPEKWKLIVQVIDAPPLYGDTSKLTPIKERCPEFISWDDIKMVLCLLEMQRSNRADVESICPKFFEAILASAASASSSNVKSEPVSPPVSTASAASDFSNTQIKEEMVPPCKKAKILETEVPQVKQEVQKKVSVPVKCVGTSQMMFEDSD
ncbi:hypothetical protein B566_EDAN007803 [Ephemera danica]|nr:hypothetical protein B566_EDAN007803 [Ephemera danica]